VDTQNAAAGALEIQEDVRARIATRNKRRILKEKEHKLLRLVSGVHGFTAYTCFMSALNIGVSSVGNAVVASILVALGSLFAYVFIAIWRNKLPPIWLVALPSTLFVAIGLFFGIFLSLAFWLNVSAHIEIPFLYRLKKQLASFSD
jgi:hypothetical protein